MCIFARPVADVSATRIFVSHLNRERLVVYQMHTKLGSRLPERRGKQAHGNTMILPVPTDDASTIALMDLTSVPKFFDDIEAKFERPFRGRGFATKGIPAKAAKKLDVVEVGSYKASIAPTLADILNADDDVFEISPEATRMLARHYSVGFAFVIARLQNGGTIHPLAYTYLVAEGDNTLFVPTRHEHGDSGMPHWDHTVYTVHRGFEPEEPDDDEGYEDEDDDDGEESSGALLNAPQIVSPLGITKKGDFAVPKTIGAVPGLASFMPARNSELWRYKWRGMLANVDVEFATEF